MVIVLVMVAPYVTQVRVHEMPKCMAKLALGPMTAMIAGMCRWHSWGMRMCMCHSWGNWGCARGILGTAENAYVPFLRQLRMRTIAWCSLGCEGAWRETNGDAHVPPARCSISFSSPQFLLVVELAAPPGKQRRACLAGRVAPTAGTVEVWVMCYV